MALTVQGSPADLELGPGVLFVAPYGGETPVAEPTAAQIGASAAAWPTGWVPLGYTEEGHSFSYQPSFEDVTVAEEMLPIITEPTGVTMTMSFSLAEITAFNLALALNQVSPTATAGVYEIEPPELEGQARVMIGWSSIDQHALFVARKCIQTGNVELARRKAPAKTLIPCEFRLEMPGGGDKAFKYLTNR